MATQTPTIRDADSLFFCGIQTPELENLGLRTSTPALEKPGLQLRAKNQTPTPGCNVCVLKDDLRETL